MEFMAPKFVKPLFSVFKSGCLTCFVLNYVGDFTLCTDSLMEPTIHSGDIILVEYMTQPKLYVKGDIIITKSPVNPLFYACKRIAGLPGDRVHHGNLLQYVPVGHVWLQNDSSQSDDFLNDEPIPQGLLIGRAVCVLWPLSHISLFTKREYRSYNDLYK